MRAGLITGRYQQRVALEYPLGMQRPADYDRLVASRWGVVLGFLTVFSSLFSLAVALWQLLVLYQSVSNSAQQAGFLVGAMITHRTARLDRGAVARWLDRVATEGEQVVNATDPPTNVATAIRSPPRAPAQPASASCGSRSSRRMRACR